MPTRLPSSHAVKFGVRLAPVDVVWAALAPLLALYLRDDLVLSIKGAPTALPHCGLSFVFTLQLHAALTAAVATRSCSRTFRQTLGISCHEIGDDPASTGPPLPVLIADFRDNVRRSDHDAPQGCVDRRHYVSSLMNLSLPCWAVTGAVSAVI